MMKSNKQRFYILVWLVLFTAQACVLTNFFQTPADETEPSLVPTIAAESHATLMPTPQPSQTQTVEPASDLDSIEWIDILPIEVIDGLLYDQEGQVLLYAGAGIASSNAGTDAYHARQALGKPNTLICGRYVTAWQPAPDETEAWIELYYKPFILPNRINVAMSYRPSQISKIEVVTLDDETVTVFDWEENGRYLTDDCPTTRIFWLEDVDELISTVRITLQREVDEEWTQIDAVGVLGWIGDGPVEPTEIRDWTDEEFGYDYGYWITPRYYSNKNQINALTFAGDKLVTASDGGVVVWDMASLNPTPYTAAQGLPTNVTTALAYCDWDDDKVVVGGLDWIALFDHEYFDFIQMFDANFFTYIHHPNEKALGKVTALACHRQQEQIWAGYLGHLSRYDLRSQQWINIGRAEGMPFDVVRQIRIIDDEVWVVTEQGVAVVRDNNKLTFYSPDNSEIPSDFVHAIVADEAGVKWMASSHGLIEFNGQDWRLWRSSDIAGKSLLDTILGLDVDPDGDIWVVDALGTLCQFSPITKQCLQVIEPPDPLDGITAFQVDAQGRLALGSFNDGVRIVLDDEWFKLMTRDQILDNVIHAIAYAPDGNLWLATRAGVQYLLADRPAYPWQQVPLPKHAVPYTLYVALDGVWIGHTQGAYLSPYLDQEPVELPIGDPENAIANTVTAITIDKDGLVYFGTRGLSIWDGNQFFYEDLLSTEERSRNVIPPQVNVLYADGDVVWVGASNGLYQFQQGKLTGAWTETLDHLTSVSRSVGVITPDYEGDGLFVAIDSSLYRFDRNTFEFVLELESEIRSVYALPHSLLLATSRSGYYSIPKYLLGIESDQNWEKDGFARQFGYQAILMTDYITLWIASSEGGLRRAQGMFYQ